MLTMDWSRLLWSGFERRVILGLGFRIRVRIRIRVRVKVLRNLGSSEETRLDLVLGHVYTVSDSFLLRFRNIPVQV